MSLGDDEFRVLLDLHMVSDPWPLDSESHGILRNLLNREAEERGYVGWSEAYHEFEG